MDTTSLRGMYYPVFCNSLNLKNIETGFALTHGLAVFCATNIYKNIFVSIENF